MPIKHSVLNAPERPEYARALSYLEPILLGLPPKVVAIDGAHGVGKTTLGRFLAWRFNISLIETDLFLLEGTGRYLYRDNDLRAVLKCGAKVAEKLRHRPGMSHSHHMRRCGASRLHRLENLCRRVQSRDQFGSSIGFACDFLTSKSSYP